DPIGWRANAGTSRQLWVGYPQSGLPLAAAGNKTGLIPRRPLDVKDPLTGLWVPLGQPGTTLAGTQRILSRFTLLDDLTFESDGTLKSNSGVAERQGRYSWAYL